MNTKVIKQLKSKYTLLIKTKNGFKIFGRSNQLYKLLLTAYGIDNFCINHLHFYFKPEWFDESVRSSMYDSFFYTFVSMVLTRSERDKFIKLFRKGDK